MDDIQRCEQMTIYIILLGLLGVAFKGRLPTWIYGMDVFLHLELWYEIPISFNLLFVFFIFWMGVFSFFYDFDSVSLEEEDEE
ncbi:MAG: hypothetical protein ACOC80_12080 [Petrotogales bacterium]